VNKKKQKNFIHSGRAGFSATGPIKQKLLRRFSQKAASFPILNFPEAKFWFNPRG
jgi:hypothetical protein